MAGKTRLAITAALLAGAAVTTAYAQIGVDLGGTQMAEALQDVLSLSMPAKLQINRQADVILITDGEIYDVVAGSFLVVGLTDENFGSLTPDQMKTFEEKFHSPEVFIRMGRGIMAVPLPDEKIEKQQEKKLDAPELKPHKKVKEEAL